MIEFDIGNYVKIIRNREAFWVCYEGYCSTPLGFMLIGTVENDLIREHFYGYGDRILFHPSEVIEVWKDETNKILVD